MQKHNEKNTNFKKPAKNPPSLYGFHAVRAAWLNPQRNVHVLYVTDQSQKGFDVVLEEARRKGLRRPAPALTDKKTLERMLPQGAVHQGLALACDSLPETDEHDLLIRLHGRKEATIAILDQVTDPHNVGAILRSASAFGVDGVIMQKKHAPALDGVLAKTACGAVEHIPVAQATNLARAVETLKEQGFFVFGLDERGAQTIREISRPEKTVIILGSEGEGIRRLIKESCDSLLRLPTEGEIASLNVSNAAAVAFYALKG